MSAGQIRLSKYSLGVGDRFAHQAKAQLRAFQQAAARGVQVVPVWNKSNREHETVHSQPDSVRAAADAAVRALAWDLPYFVDADHITMATVDRFVAPCDFFTLDVADAIGRPPEPGAVEAFLARHPELVGSISVAGVAGRIRVTREAAARAATHYLSAVAEAGRVYRHVVARKGAGTFVTEVSMDETDTPQTPAELLVILAAVANEGIPAQTIAPRFSGRFNKGVDYVGDVAAFEKEFGDDVAVIAHAVRTYGLPRNLKLSVHSGSDKFSIFPADPPDAAADRRRSPREDLGHDVAGGVDRACGGGRRRAGAGKGRLRRRLPPTRGSSVLPTPASSASTRRAFPHRRTVQQWTAGQFTAAVRHDPANRAFDPNVRQLLHVGYKIAASLGERYTDLLDSCEDTIARNVTANLYERHLVPLFIAD